MVEGGILEGKVCLHSVQMPFPPLLWDPQSVESGEVEPLHTKCQTRAWTVVSFFRVRLSAREAGLRCTHFQQEEEGLGRLVLVQPSEASSCRFFLCVSGG